MRYIDLKTKHHTLEEHMEVVEELLKDGYRYVGSRFNNPCFLNIEKDDDVCILASVITQDGYFAI